MTTKRLPVLFLNDVVLLPGMVVPIELDESAQAAVDAAAAGSDDELLVAPRLEDRYASYGVVAAIEKVGRFRGGESAAVLRTGRRARIGSGVTGPGAALWVEVEDVEEQPVTERAVELAAEYKKLVVAVLQKREAWQIVDTVNAIDDPAIAGRHGRVGVVPLDGPQAPAARDSRHRGAADASGRVDPRLPGRGRRQREDQRGRPGVGREEPAGVPAPPAACSDPQGARRGRARRRRRLPRPGRGRRRAGPRPRGAAARGEQARALQRPEPGDELDPDLAGHRARAAVAGHHDRLDRHRRRSRSCSTRTTTASTRSRSGSWSTSPSVPVAPRGVSR